jgi:hypothetical protein
MRPANGSDRFFSCICHAGDATGRADVAGAPMSLGRGDARVAGNEAKGAKPRPYHRGVDAADSVRLGAPAMPPGETAGRFL